MRAIPEASWWPFKLVFWCSLLFSAFNSQGATVVKTLAENSLLTEVAIESVHKRVKNFDPERVVIPSINLSSLRLNPEVLSNVGSTAAVFPGKMNGKDVVIKLYRRKMSLPALKQNYFIGEVVSELGLAPKPYGYLAGEQAKALCQNLGVNSEYYGEAIIYDRVNPIFLEKFSPHRNMIPFSPKIKQAVDRSLNTLERLGVKIVDLDFYVDENGRFGFLDLDNWGIQSEKGGWRYGVFHDSLQFGPNSPYSDFIVESITGSKRPFNCVHTQLLKVIGTH